MAEVFGVATGALQVADAGLKLAKTLYDYLDAVRNANRHLQAVALEVRVTSSTLQSLGLLLKDHDAEKLCSQHIIADASSAFKGCEDTFNEVSELFKSLLRDPSGSTGGNTKISSTGRWIWPFKKGKVEMLQSNLERLKTTLLLMLSVLSFARDSTQRTNDSEAKLVEQKRQIQDLMKARQEAIDRHEQLIAAFARLETKSTTQVSINSSQLTMNAATDASQVFAASATSFGVTSSFQETEDPIRRQLANCASAISRLHQTIQSVSAMYNQNRVLGLTEIQICLQEVDKSVQNMEQEVNCQSLGGNASNFGGSAMPQSTDQSAQYLLEQGRPSNSTSDDWAPESLDSKMEKWRKLQELRRHREQRTQQVQQQVFSRYSNDTPISFDIESQLNQPQTASGGTTSHSTGTPSGTGSLPAPPEITIDYFPVSLEDQSLSRPSRDARRRGRAKSDRPVSSDLPGQHLTRWGSHSNDDSDLQPSRYRQRGSSGTAGATVPEEPQSPQFEPTYESTSSNNLLPAALLKAYPALASLNWSQIDPSHSSSMTADGGVNQMEQTGDDAMPIDHPPPIPVVISPAPQDIEEARQALRKSVERGDMHYYPGSAGNLGSVDAKGASADKDDEDEADEEDEAITGDEDEDGKALLLGSKRVTEDSEEDDDEDEDEGEDEDSTAGQDISQEGRRRKRNKNNRTMYMDENAWVIDEGYDQAGEKASLDGNIAQSPGGKPAVANKPFYELDNVDQLLERWTLVGK